MELRCDSSILHGILEGGAVEVACKSARCGKQPGVTILHTFNTTTGKLESTRAFRNPKDEEVNSNGNQ